MIAILNFAALFMALQEPPKLSLDEALRIAHEKAFALKIADSNIEKARQRVNEAKGALGPKLTLDASYTRFDKAQTTEFGGNTIVTRPVDSKDAKLTFNMPFDIAGVTSKVIRGAFLSREIQVLARQVVSNDLDLTVKRAYYQVLQAEAQEIVAQEDVNRAAERLKNVQAEFQAGARAKVDVLNFETQLRQSENTLVQAKGNVQLAKNLLNNALGRPIETPFDAEPATFWQPTKLSDEELVKQAEATRAELKSNLLQIDLLAFIREAEERGNLPSLNLSVNHSRTFGQTGFGASSGSTVGVLAVSWPIFDSGVTRARVKQARQDEVQAKIQREQLTLGISLEVRQAKTNLNNADSRLTVAKKAVELAEETYRLQTLRFSAGEGIPLEVANAGTELTRAKNNLVLAQYDYLRAIAELERAVGGTLMEGGK